MQLKIWSLFIGGPWHNRLLLTDDRQYYRAPVIQKHFTALVRWTATERPTFNVVDYKRDRNGDYRVA